MVTDKRYYFYKNPFYKVYATVEDGLVRMHTSGVASRAIKPLTSEMLDLFEGQRPALVRGEELVFSTWMPPIPSKAFDRLVSSQMGYIRGKMVPEQVTISITEDCPNNCIHCALPDTKNRASLSAEDVKSTIDQVLDMGSTFIVFDGGEPLVYEGLEELISYVDGDLATTGMFTSGVGLTKERAISLKEAGLDMLSISLDSSTEKGHDTMRGRVGVFKDAIGAVKNSLDAGLLVNIYVVISPGNIDELDDFYKIATDLGVHEISFFEIVPTGRWMNRLDEMMTADDHKKFDDFVKRTESMDGPKVFAIPHVLKKMGCFAGRKWLHITPEGDIFPCSCLPLSFGNIHEDKLSDVWRKIRKDSTYNGGTCLMRDSDFRKLHKFD
ncbi:radical SAM protein [Methanococcoides orientis]|uniref:radical SAM protein n=1 Tax=Methanococcoides orientis TaxID=2822137 RepID=UPI001E28FF39|nr:radical SAM protein [Methanococcoides orientis]UGV41810.1 radical SAM protein [Methanococcoides orientis]